MFFCMRIEGGAVGVALFADRIHKEHKMQPNWTAFIVSLERYSYL